MVQISGGYHNRDIDKAGPELFVNFGSAQRSWGIAEWLLEEAIYPVVSTSLKETLVHPRDVLEHRLIDVDGHKVNWASLLKSQGINSALSAEYMHVDSTEIALAMAASGYGIALARTPITDSMLESYGLVPCPGFEPVAAREGYYLMYRSEKALSVGAKKFRQWLLAQLQSESEGRIFRGAQ